MKCRHQDYTACEKPRAISIWRVLARNSAQCSATLALHFDSYGLGSDWDSRTIRPYPTITERTRLCEVEGRKASNGYFAREFLHSLKLKLSLRVYQQAYDGHMNLILSDVEETIMIVDNVEGNTNPENATVNVSSIAMNLCMTC